MQFSQELFSDVNYIHSYEAQEIFVKNKNALELQRFDSNFILTADTVITAHDSYKSEISENSLNYLIGLAPEIVIIATEQKKGIFLTAKVLARFHQKSIGVESMAFGAACRTYNLLIAEERNVVLFVMFD